MRKRKIGPTDQNHVAKINAFIPEAEKIARKAVKDSKRINVGAVANLYSREFHRAMNQLTVAAGLRVA